MKKLLFYTSVLLLVSCSQQAENGPFDWLPGSWVRSNDPAGRQTFEHWEKESITSYRGHGYTLAGGDTVWQEQIWLHAEGGDWQFEVSGEDGSTRFAVSSIGKQDFICKNPAHDFPQKISYHLGGDSLKAVISGGGEQVVFMFGRK
ncbi:MAG: DUF6265 family protein [Bacteroidia bacterium]